jgi:hypothetical protein
LKDSKTSGFEFNRDKELAHRFIKERTHKRLKALYNNNNNNMTDSDNRTIANAKKTRATRKKDHTHKTHNPIPLLQLNETTY